MLFNDHKIFSKIMFAKILEKIISFSFILGRLGHIIDLSTSSGVVVGVFY